MLVAKNQQSGSLTGQPHTSTKNDALSIVSSTTRSQMAPVNAPLPAPINISPAWPIASNVSGAVGYQMAPARAPLPPPTNAQALPTAYTMPSAVRYQMTSATVIPQQKIFPFIQQRPMVPAYPRLIVPLPLALPRVMRVVECRFCNTKTQTDAYTYVDCSNPDCDGRICLLDNCFRIFSKQKRVYLVRHQNTTHCHNANLFQCYSCKAPKPRGNPNIDTDSCPVCKVNWCLIKNCTFETPFATIQDHWNLKHQDT